MSTLIYIGANVGNSLSSFVNSYDSIHVFEPDLEMFDGFKNILNQNYEFIYGSLGRLDDLIVSENEIPADEYEWDSLWTVNV